jgi:hypothetical protein
VLLQDRAKPGRQIVTFLLICNLAIWVIYTFEVQKVEESPVQVSRDKQDWIKLTFRSSFGRLQRL